MNTQVNSVSVAEAKAHLSEILNKVILGKPVTITRRGQPVATIQPLARPKKPININNIDKVRSLLPTAKTPALDLIHAVRSEREQGPI